MKLPDFKKIISYFKHGGHEEKKAMLSRDWKIIVAAFVFILIAVFFVDGYVFWKYQMEPYKMIELGENKDEVINQNSLKKVLDKIERREKKFNENILAPDIADPSL